MPDISQVPFIGIYSFPKSGNTWIRHIIAALFFDGQVDAIPDLHQQSPTQARIAQLPDGREFRFYKSHSAQHLHQHRKYPIKNAAVIYIYRHPLDLFLSYLNYLYLGANRDNLSKPRIPVRPVEELVKTGEIEYYFDCFLVFGTLQPFFTSATNWFSHLAYWLDEERRKVFPIRYEDLVVEGAGALKDVSEFLNVAVDPLEQALEKARDATKVNGKFFWKQRPGLYQELLPPHLIERFQRYHGSTIAKYGYQAVTRSVAP